MVPISKQVEIRGPKAIIVYFYCVYYYCYLLAVLKTNTECHLKLSRRWVSLHHPLPIPKEKDRLQYKGSENFQKLDIAQAIELPRKTLDVGNFSKNVL